MDRILEVAGLVKRYGSFTAVDGVDFDVERGALFAFLGPNGAGKSTTIGILCTLAAPDGGTCRIDGHVLTRDDDAIRKSIGVVFQEGVLDPLLTVRENLAVRASLYGLNGRKITEAVRNAVESVGVGEYADRPYGKLSGGQRRRADIARALIHRPKLLFLDEPTTGLDPSTRRSVWNTVRELQHDTGMTVFLTTHYMEEAAKADDVAVIDHGRITARGTPSALRERYSRDRLVMTPADPDAAQLALRAQGRDFEFSGGNITVYLSRTTDAIPLIKAFEDKILFLEVIAGSMDDVFLTITGEGGEE